MWGFMRYGAIPDVVTVGKPMGNGYPMAGVITRPQLLIEFGAKARYFNTIGGNPVAAAAGMAVLDVIRNEELQENAQNVGTFMQMLEASAFASFCQKW